MVNQLMRQWKALVLAVSLATAAQASAQTSPSERLPMPLAREVVQRAIELVETRALLPRQQNEYARAKADLFALLDGQSADIERRILYMGINKVLGTLDVDGHSFIVSPSLYEQRQQVSPQPAGQASFRLVTTANGPVLHWTPPQIVSSTMEARAAYLKRFDDDAAQLKEMEKTCAVVVDLTEQKGGNAWPPFIAMHPLFGTANKAYMVDRDGKRTPFVIATRLKELGSVYAAGRPNPLERFSNLPVAVVVGARTSSAGEMLLVALLGEGERVQTFGHTSHGMSTANATYPLPDKSVLVLTESRYAVGDQAVFHRGIPVAHPAAGNDSADVIVNHAAEWVARQSPLCAAKQQVAALMQ